LKTPVFLKKKEMSNENKEARNKQTINQSNTFDDVALLHLHWVIEHQQHLMPMSVPDERIHLR
jgi:hypothetical protein